MKIRISMKETSTAGSVYSAPSMESQEQQLPSDEELAVRDQEEADRQEQQAEKDRKEAAKKAKEKAAKLPPADKEPGGDKKEGGGGDDEESEDDSEDDEDMDDEDMDDEDMEDMEDDDEESEDDSDDDEESEDDEEATAAAIVAPVVPAPATPRNRPYPDAYVEQTPDVILPVKERELTPEEIAAKAEKDAEKPVADNADAIIPEKPKGNETGTGEGAGDTNKDGGAAKNDSATKEVATAATVRVRPYPDCWND